MDSTAKTFQLSTNKYHIVHCTKCAWVWTPRNHIQECQPYVDLDLFSQKKFNGQPINGDDDIIAAVDYTPETSTKRAFKGTR